MSSDQAVILVITVAGFYPVSKVLKWLWRHNVSGPAWDRADTIVTTVVIRELKERDQNGGHNLTDISDKVDAIAEKLDERTQVTRVGSSEPEALGHYAQDRLHELGTVLTGVAFRVELMWRHLKNGDPLPDLPSIAKVDGDST